jgi:hypothetical protein
MCWAGSGDGLSHRWAGLTVVLFVLALSGPVWAQHQPRSEELRIRLNVLDTVSAASGSRFHVLTMNQSLGLTAAWFEGMHLAAGRLSETIPASAPGAREAMAWGTIFAIDGLSNLIPGGLGWMHEEWHRAVLGRWGIGSRNGVYDFEGGGVVPVYGLLDDELAALKRRSPADLVRLHLAGDESFDALSQRWMEDTLRFGGVRRRWGPVRFSTRRLVGTHGWMLLLHNLYLAASASGGFDEEVETISAGERSERERDFAGPDFTAWVYDLHRPSEPYEFRGIHPTGVGIDRYRTTADLSGRERRWLSLQSRLAWLNVVDPQLFQIAWFEDRVGRRWTGRLRHQLLPWGHQLSARVLVDQPDPSWGAAAGLQLGRNGVRSFAGASGTMWWRPMGSMSWELRADVSAWQQPEDLRFDDNGSAAAAGGELQAVWWTHEHLGVALDVGAKSYGYMPFVESLQSAAWGRLTLVIRGFERAD